MDYPPTTPDRATGQIIEADHINGLGDGIDAIVTELGANPSGAAATVDARIGAVETSVAGKAATSHTHDASAVTTGILDPERLGSGTPTSGTTLTGTGWVATPALIEGPAGPAGADGTVIGLLGPGETPPPGTPAGTLWWVADDEFVIPDPGLATPTHVGSAAYGATGSITSHSLTLPAGIAAGDFAVVTVGYSAANPPTSVTSGWTSYGTVTYSSTFEIAFYTRELDGSETTFAVTLASGSRVGISCVVVDNVDGIGNFGFDDGTPSATKAAPAIGHTSEFVVIAGWVERDSTPSTALTAPAGLDGSVSAFGSGGSGCVSVAAGRYLTVTDPVDTVSLGDWVATNPDTVAGLVVWTMALIVSAA